MVKTTEIFKSFDHLMEKVFLHLDTLTLYNLIKSGKSVKILDTPRFWVLKCAKKFGSKIFFNAWMSKLRFFEKSGLDEDATWCLRKIFFNEIGFEHYSEKEVEDMFYVCHICDTKTSFSYDEPIR